MAETQNLETSTATLVQEKNEPKELKMETPLFIIFAEYLGYVSRFIKIAEDWCNGKIPKPYVQKAMNVEALCMYRAIKDDMTDDEVRYWYDTYYPIILAEYDEKLSQMQAPTDD